MIITLEDILDELEDEYPEITRDSLKKICKKGLTHINRYTRSGDDLIMRGHELEETRIYVPMSPEAQIAKMRRKYYANKKKEDAKSNNNK